MADERLRPEHYFDLSAFEHKAIFDEIEYVWDVLPKIGDYVKSYVEKRISEVDAKVLVTIPQNTIIEGDVHIEEGAEIESFCVIKGKVYIEKGVHIKTGTVIDGTVCIKNDSEIGPNAVILGANVIGELCEIRPGALTRGAVLMGIHTVFRGEAKNVIFLDAVETKEGVLAETAAAHFAYVGDSVMGRSINLGAGTKISNVKVNWEKVEVLIDDKKYNTGLSKFGAIIGDQTSTGCNTVLNPGTLVGKRVKIYPNSSIIGYYPPDTIVKLRSKIELAERVDRDIPTLDGRI